MKNKVLVDVTVRRKSPAEVVFLTAVVCVLSFVIDWQGKKIWELRKELSDGTVY